MPIPILSRLIEERAPPLHNPRFKTESSPSGLFDVKDLEQSRRKPM